MFVSTRLALVSLLVSVVLVAAAAAADSKSKKLTVVPSPLPHRTRAPAPAPAQAIFKDEKDGAIDYGAMTRDGIPCDINHQENCRPQRNGNEYNRGCNPITRCRSGSRRMLLEDQLGVAPDFGALKDYLTNKFFK